MRVNIEESVWSDIRFKRLANAMSVPVYMAVGVMAHLWHAAQSNEADAWTEEDIELLLGNELGAPSFQQIFASGLLRSKNGKYELVGIKQRLEEISEYNEKKRNAGRLGGLKSAESRRSKTQASASAKNDKIEPSMSMSMSMSMSKEENNTDKHPPPPSAAASGGTVLSEYEWPNNEQLKRTPQAEIDPPDFVEVEVVEKSVAVVAAPKPARKPKPKPQISEADENLAKRWFAWSKTLSPHINASQESFGRGIFEAKRSLARTIPDGDLDGLLEALFDFVQKDSFWGKNCLSPCGLLKPSTNGLRKVDNVISAMRRDEMSAKQRSIAPGTISDDDWAKYV